MWRRRSRACPSRHLRASLSHVTVASSLLLVARTGRASRLPRALDWSQSPGGEAEEGASERSGPGERARAAAAGAACAPRRGWRWPEQRECDEAALPRCSARRQLTAPTRSTPGGEPRGRDLGRGGKSRGQEGRRRRHPESLGPLGPHPVLILLRREPRSPGTARRAGRAGALRTPRSTVLKLLPGAAGASVRGKAACLPAICCRRERGPSRMRWTQLFLRSWLIAPGLCS